MLHHLTWQLTLLLALAIVYGNDYLVTLTDAPIVCTIIPCGTDSDCESVHGR